MKKEKNDQRFQKIKKYKYSLGFFSEWNVGGLREGEIYFRDSD